MEYSDMAYFYVNDNPQSTGEHEVHQTGCVWLTKVKSKTGLGQHQSCHEALKAAAHIYTNVDGCATCSPDCHHQ